ncbi:MAG TPA: hypothetical protein VFF00_07610, partial [Candidatus Elarobacter sp.]|nr:hypothetical protein [Candidatus Elarobacter sp.]
MIPTPLEEGGSRKTSAPPETRHEIFVSKGGLRSAASARAVSVVAPAPRRMSAVSASSSKLDNAAPAGGATASSRKVTP